MIKLENVSYKYSNNNLAISDINLELNEGEITVIIGKNGSGKSTLLSTIANIYKYKGNIYLDNLDIKKIANKDFRKEIGIVFQDPNNQIIFPKVYDNLSFVLNNLGYDDIDNRIIKALELVSMKEYINENPYNLSLGQKQRIALATTLVTNPKYLLLDEITSMIDYQGKKEIYSLILKLKQEGIGIIFGTNILEELVYADKIVIISKNIKKVLTKKELFNNLDVLYSIDADFKNEFLNIKLSSKYQDEKLLGLKLFSDGKDNYLLLEDLYNKYLKVSNTETEAEEEQTSDISKEDLEIIINGFLKAIGDSFTKDDFLREKVTINHDDKKIDVYKNYLVYNNKNCNEIDSKIIENIKANNELVNALKKVLGEEEYNELIKPSEEEEYEFNSEFIVYTKGLTNEFVRVSFNYQDDESVISIDCDYDTITVDFKEKNENIKINIEQNDNYNYIVSFNVTDGDGNTSLIKLSLIGESIENIEKVNVENAVLLEKLTEEDQNLIMQKLSENKTLTKFIEDISKILNGDFALEM